MKKKLIILYMFFAIIPLMIMDAVVVGGIIRTEETKTLHEMESVAEAIKYTCQGEVETAARFARSVYTSRYIYNYMNRDYSSALEYYEAYLAFFDDTLISFVSGQSDVKYVIYANNTSMINGSQFQSIDKAKGQPWYVYARRSGLPAGLFFYYGRNTAGTIGNERRVYFFKTLDYFDHESQNILLVELDYTRLNTLLSNMNSGMPAYVCDSDRILLSNNKDSNIARPFNKVSELTNIGYTADMKIYDRDFQIHVINNGNNMKGWFKNWGWQLVLLGILNIFLPAALMTWINRIAYSYKLREQEMVLTRQHAELHALHSQINPHFLFNALESIRMHSIIKKESETAYMVEKLAKLQRQYTEWNQDNVTIEQEIGFVENYLELQKYRFGDRLSYSIDVGDECLKFKVPKLTIVTFVENACVHGIESKISNGWIFLRIYEKEDMLCIEVEDTGNGMSSEETSKLLESMRNANINMLQEKGRVGVINASLRLKMVTDDKTIFDVDSEEGIGTIVTIKIPIDSLKGIF